MNDSKSEVTDDELDFPTVQIVCNSSRHARGKVAKVVLYCRDEDGSWTSYMPVGLKTKLRLGKRLSDRGVDEQEITNRLWNRPSAPIESVVPKCNLCQRRLPDGFDNLHGDAEVLDRVATRGDATISLAELHALASNQRKG